jgi:hypothetical protein
MIGASSFQQGGASVTITTKNGLTLMFAMLVLLLMQTARAADVTGTWIMSVQTSAGSGSPTFTLVQTGDSLSGTYKGQLGEAPVTGTISGNDITLEFNIDAQGQSLTIKYTGKVDGKSVSGNVALGAFGSGTFTGTKQ